VKPQPLPDSDESYRLTVDANGVDISANTRFGALRAMETLLQLMQNGAENTSLPWVTIEDSPLPVARAAATRRATLFRCRISSARSTAWPRRSSTCCTGT
jgi:hypothetical protein